MEFVDLICDSKQAHTFLGLDDEYLHDDDDDDHDHDHDHDMGEDDTRDDDYDQEEVDFEEEDDDTLFTDDDDDDDDTQTQTDTCDGTDTYDGSTLGDDTSKSLLHSDLAEHQEQPAYQKTTPLFEAIDSHYWSTVTTFVTTGRWTSSSNGDGGRRMPMMVPLQEEARQWSVSLDMSGKVTSRRLPLHAALMNAAPVHIIARLVDLYPHAVQCIDSQGNLPLHLAFLYEGNDAPVVDLIFHAFPKAVLVKNHKKGNGSSGKLPMECWTKARSSKASSPMKVVLRRCQTTARELSLQQVRQGGDFQDTDLVKAASSNNSSSRGRRPSMRKTSTASASATASAALSVQPANSNNSRESAEIMALKKELQELRRESSSTSASKANSQQGDAKSNDAGNTSKDEAAGSSDGMEGWMRGLTQGAMFRAAMGTSTKNNDNTNAQGSDDGLDKSTRSVKSARSVKSVNKSNAAESSPSPMMSRWKRSFNKLSTSKNGGGSGSGDKEEDNTDEVMTKDDSIDNMDNNSASRSLSKNSQYSSYKKRLSLNNPFRKRQKADPTLRGGEDGPNSADLSVSDNSISRFTLSAVPDGPDQANLAAAAAAAATGGGRSTTSKSVGTKVATASSARKLFSASTRQLRPSNWMKHRRSQSETAANTHSNRAKEDTVVFDDTVEDAPGDGTKESVFTSAWKMDTSSMVAKAMSGMLLSDVREEDATQDAPSTGQPKRRRSGVFGGKSVDNNNTDQQHISFLENSLIRPTAAGSLPPEASVKKSSSKQSLKSFRRTLSKSLKKDKSAAIKPEDSEETRRSESHRDDESQSSSSSGDSSHTSTSGSESISSVTPSHSSDEDSFSHDDHEEEEEEDEDDIVARSHLQMGERHQHEWRGASPSSWICAQDGALSTILSQASEMRTDPPKQKFTRRHTTKAREQRSLFTFQARDQPDETSNARSKKATSFGVFRRKKSNISTGGDVASLAGQMQQTTLEGKEAPTKVPIKASHLHDFSHIASHRRNESASSLDASIARAILPRDGNWRAEYDNYISSQHSAACTAEKGKDNRSPAIKKKKKKTTIRGIMKESHRRLKSMDGKQQRRSKPTDLKSTPLLANTAPGANDILDDLESGFPLLLDTTSAPDHQRDRSFSQSQILPTDKDASTGSTGPVVSEAALETSDTSNVYLVRVQF